MAFQLFGRNIVMGHANTQVTDHVFREAICVDLEEIRGNRHLFHVESLGGAA